MKKNKGFTLIELLAVIAILAIVLLIAIPTVLNMIDRARIGSFRDSCLAIIKSAESEVALYNIGEVSEDDFNTDCGRPTSTAINFETGVTCTISGSYANKMFSMDLAGWSGTINIKQNASKQYVVTLNDGLSNGTKMIDSNKGAVGLVSSVVKSELSNTGWEDFIQNKETLPRTP